MFLAEVAETFREAIFADERGVAVLRCCCCCSCAADGVAVLEAGIFAVLAVDELLSERATGRIVLAEDDLLPVADCSLPAKDDNLDTEP